MGFHGQRARARLRPLARSYISVHDVAEFAVLAAGNPRATNRDLHIGGPEPLSADDAVRIAEQITGRRFKVQRMPSPMLKALSAILRPFAPIPSSLMAMGTEQEDGDRVDMASILRDFPVQLTSFEQYVRSAIGAGR